MRTSLFGTLSAWVTAITACLLALAAGAPSLAVAAVPLASYDATLQMTGCVTKRYLDRTTANNVDLSCDGQSTDGGGNTRTAAGRINFGQGSASEVSPFVAAQVEATNAEAGAMGEMVYWLLLEKIGNAPVNVADLEFNALVEVAVEGRPRFLDGAGGVARVTLETGSGTPISTLARSISCRAGSTCTTDEDFSTGSLKNTDHRVCTGLGHGRLPRP